MGAKGPLCGIRILEFAGIGPGPFAGMLLADLGADIILIERPARRGDPLDLGKNNILNRGKRSICLDLKNPRAVELVLGLVRKCDALIEGMRPGVMERLGLGPEAVLLRQPKLVYGRMTGWGQEGPLAQRAGHDINYIARSGALWYSGQAGEAPLAPPTLVGDLGGGALYLALGLVAGVLHARTSGEGQVVDAAIVDGSANLMNLLLSLRGAGSMPVERGAGLLDGPFWYGSYRCADGRFVTVGAIEPQFNAELLKRLGFADDEAFARPYDWETWPRGRQRMAKIFATADRDHWCQVFEDSDACFAPVLDPSELMSDPHLKARGTYFEADGLLQAAPAPRFSVFPSATASGVPGRSADWRNVLTECGLSPMTDADAEAVGIIIH
ncbi:MAG: CoA transferase [Rhodocyclaceae bacterium]|nr:CoA transferase [Rhodocyclaceae bacterium]